MYGPVPLNMAAIVVVYGHYLEGNIDYPYSSKYIGLQNALQVTHTPLGHPLWPREIYSQPCTLDLSTRWTRRARWLARADLPEAQARDFDCVVTVLGTLDLYFWGLNECGHPVFGPFRTELPGVPADLEKGYDMFDNSKTVERIKAYCAYSRPL